MAASSVLIYACDITNGWARFTLGALLGVLLADITIDLLYHGPDS